MAAVSYDGDFCAELPIAEDVQAELTPRKRAGAARVTPRKRAPRKLQRNGSTTSAAFNSCGSAGGPVVESSGYGAASSPVPVAGTPTRTPSGAAATETPALGTGRKRQLTANDSRAEGRKREADIRAERQRKRVEDTTQQHGGGLHRFFQPCTQSAKGGNRLSRPAETRVVQAQLSDEGEVCSSFPSPTQMWGRRVSMASNVVSQAASTVGLRTPRRSLGCRIIRGGSSYEISATQPMPIWHPSPTDGEVRPASDGLPPGEGSAPASRGVAEAGRADASATAAPPPPAAGFAGFAGSAAAPAGATGRQRRRSLPGSEECLSPGPTQMWGRCLDSPPSPSPEFGARSQDLQDLQDLRRRSFGSSGLSPTQPFFPPSPARDI